MHFRNLYCLLHYNSFATTASLAARKSKRPCHPQKSAKGVLARISLHLSSSFGVNTASPSINKPAKPSNIMSDSASGTSSSHEPDTYRIFGAPLSVDPPTFNITRYLEDRSGNITGEGKPYAIYSDAEVAVKPACALGDEKLEENAPSFLKDVEVKELSAAIISIYPTHILCPSLTNH
jgi:hypothetical protein